MHPRTQLAAAYACLALSMSLVGSYVALSKPLVATFPVFLLAWMRFAIGALAMLRWLPRAPTQPPLDARSRTLLFLQSFLGNFLFSLCMLWGVSLTSAVSAGVVMASLPAVVAILSRVFLRERIGARTGASVACAAAGMALLALRPDGDGAAATSLAGMALVFGAVVCEAAYAVIGKSLAGRIGARRVTALINLWGLALATPFGLYAALGFNFAAVPPSNWVLLVFYGLAASVWSVWLWMTGLRRVPASRAGVFTVMLPVAAAITGVLALGETLGMARFAALALAASGIVLATVGTPSNGRLWRSSKKSDSSQ